MKAVRLILACFFFSLIFSSCKKDSELSITGKWMPREAFYGYTDGGDFQWHQISDPTNYIIEFTSDGYYIQGYPGCNGTYTVTNHDINYITPCGSYSESFYFEYLPNYLIISYFVREGVVKVKYSRVN